MAWTGNADCSTAVLDGVWPYELMVPRPETEAVARYLHEDLLRIAARANARLAEVAAMGMPPAELVAAQRRLVDTARAMAVLRVESTVRQLGAPSLLAESEWAAVGGQLSSAAQPSVGARLSPMVQVRPVVEAAAIAAPPPPAPLEPPGPAAVPVGAVIEPAAAKVVEPVAAPEVAAAQDLTLQAVLGVLCRQRPTWAWVVGRDRDDAVVVATDMAGGRGWIPPQVVIPLGAFAVVPGRGDDVEKLAAELDPVVVYLPGDRIESRGVVGTWRPEPLAAVSVPEAIAEQIAAAAASWPGLPSWVPELAAVKASGTQVLPAERDVLAVHVDMAVGSLEPEDTAQAIGTCMLLAAVDALACDQLQAAAYHFAWFNSCVPGNI